MKKRILFVDDESLVLQGLQRLLRPMRQEWEMEFVESGPLALERLSATSYDVIVSDMMMPGMNGAQLLERVREVSPKTVRLVLSGHTEKHLALQCVGVAHQFLSKPCNADNLRHTIARATELGFAMRSETLLNVIGRMEQLPSLPAIYTQLVELLDDPASSVQDVGALIARDMALTAHLLKIVNSAFFGFAQRVNQPADAVSYLGLETLKAVVLSASLFGRLPVDPASGFRMEAAAEHGQKVAAAARAIAQTERVSRLFVEECFIAGLLHDVGRLILACNLPQLFARLGAEELRNPPADENAIFGTTHAEIGGYLLGLWGLPHAVVEATRLHHAPGDSPVREFTPLTAVHVADQLVPRASGVPGSALDLEYLTALGLAERLPVWRTAVDDLFSTAKPARI